MSVSTAGEMARLLELIARHEAVSPEASEDMLRIMRRQDYRHELSSLLPWNEMNMLANHRENWVAEKGGSFLNGVRTSAGVFHGERGPRRDVVLLNAAPALVAGGAANTWKDGIRLAAEAIDSGAALKKLHELREFN